MPASFNARRSLSPCDWAYRTSSRFAGAVTTFGAMPRGSPAPPASSPPAASSAACSPSPGASASSPPAPTFHRTATSTGSSSPPTNPCRRHRSFTASPASASRRNPMICSSEKRFSIGPIPSPQNRTPKHNATKIGDHVGKYLFLRVPVRASVGDILRVAWTYGKRGAPCLRSQRLRLSQHSSATVFTLWLKAESMFGPH